MMPIDFEEANRTLSKPSHMTDEQCGPLHIFNDGTNCVSCWQLNKEEIEEINRTGRLYLIVVSGSSQPPVSIHVESPFVK